jgi:RNase P/RNase MRP subunit p29
MIQKKELIGKIAQIRFAGRQFRGEIIDETKNMIHLKTKDKIIKIVKRNSKIKIGDEIIQGIKINKRPENRIKSC